MLFSMMILIIGFTSPPTIHFEFITKLDECITKCDSLLLQSATAFLLQSAIGYYKVQRLLQSVTEHGSRISRLKSKALGFFRNLGTI